MKKKLHRVLRRKNKNGGASDSSQPDANVPRITNNTVAAHREEVIGKARKYIYPLQHSKHRIVIVSTTLFIVAVVAFFTYCTVALYRFRDSNTFLYRVTQVIPFPVARSGGKFIAYENYLFELRRYTHYYENQVKLDFNDPKNQEQLVQFRKRALDKVVSDAYVKQLAAENKVVVTDRELDDQVAVVRKQSQLGNTSKVFEDVLKDYWDWSVVDFRRSLRSEMLAQKLVAALDTQTKAKADAALVELKGGADFAATAKMYSDEAETKDTGGEYGFAIDKSNREISAQSINSLFALQKGQISEVVNNGYSLEIYKVIDVNADKLRAAHIVFNLKDIKDYVNDQKDKQKTRLYISQN